MKIKCIIILAILILPLKGMSQITFLDNSNKKEEKTAIKYDSLSNIKYLHHDSYKHLIGQTLIYSTKLSDNHRLIYQGTNQQVHATVGAEFDVINVIPRSDLTDEDKLLLKEKSTGKTCKYNPFFGIYSKNEINTEWIVKGYYEKIKEIYKGTKLRYLNESSDYGYGTLTDNFLNIETDKELENVPYMSLWECVDVSIKIKDNSHDELRSSLILILQNELLGKCYVYVEDYSGMSWTWYEKKFKVKISNDENAIYILGKFLKEEDYNKRKDFLLKKFGKTYTDLILKKKVKIGMSKAMVEESWGEPNNINKTSGSFGVHEQWVYKDQYLYFENGKLTTIQD